MGVGAGAAHKFGNGGRALFREEGEDECVGLAGWGLAYEVEGGGA